METYCKKMIENAGKEYYLEYKMITHKSEVMDLGDITMYGIRIKLFGNGEFEYSDLREVCSKPQKALQLIKLMFDKSILPQNAQSYIDTFFKNKS